MARSFAGSSDRVITSAGGFTSLPSGSFVFLLRAGSGPSIRVLFSTTGAGYQVAYLTSSGTITFQGPSTCTSPTIQLLTSEGFVLLGLTKASGTNPVRFHKYNYATDTFTHENSASTTADVSGIVSGISLGNEGSGAQFGGDLAAGAVWSAAVISDSQFEAMAFSLQNWLAASPTAMWVFDQSATTQSVLDWTGNGANQTSVSGTSAATASVPILSYGHPVIAPTRQAGAPPSAATSTLTDNFDDNTINTTKWPQNYGTVSETGGRARVTCNSGASAYVSASNYSLDSVHVRAYPAVTTGVFGYSMLGFGPDENNRVSIYYQADTGDLTFERCTAGVRNTTTLAYSSTDHAWWRLRQSAGNMLWETSPDGATWTTRRTETAPAWLPGTTTGYVKLEGYRDSGSDIYEADNLNIAGTVTHDAAGTSTGTSSATGAVTASRLVSGTAAGTSSASGVAWAARNASGTTAATSTASGTTTLIRDATGTATGTSTAAGSAARTTAMAGTTSATSAASASSTIDRSAIGTTAGAATGLGNATVLVTPTGTASGTSAAIGSATLVGAGLSGNADGTSAASGASTVTAMASASIAGLATASGTSTISRQASGTASASGAATGAVGISLAGTSGTSSGTAGASASGLLSANAAGVAAGTSTASGAAQVTRVASGTAAGTSTASATATLTGSGLYGDANSTSGASGSATVTRAASGTAAAVSGSTGTASRTIPVAGSAAGTANASGAASLAGSGGGSADGTGGSTGNSTVTSVTSGTATASSTASATGTVYRDVSGTSAGVSTSSGNATTTSGGTSTTSGISNATGSASVVRVMLGTAGGVAAAISIAGVSTSMAGVANSISTATAVSGNPRRPGRFRVGATRPRLTAGTSAGPRYTTGG